MPVVVAPNRAYNGITANMDFAGGVAHHVPQKTEQDKHRIAWFKKRGFKVYKTEAEYMDAEGVENTEEVEEEVTLPPVEEDEEDAGLDDGVEQASNESTSGSNGGAVIKRTKAKGNRKG